MSIEVIISIVTSVIGVIGGGAGIIFWKQNKRLKEEEANQSNVETQSKEIDLGKKFLEEIMSIVKKVKDMQDTNNTETSQTLTKLTELSGDMNAKFKAVNRSLTSLNKKTKQMENYLNGPYHDWLRQQKIKENE